MMAVHAALQPIFAPDLAPVMVAAD
jgi:hypothetical protein